MKWLLIILFLNIGPEKWEVQGVEFKTKKECTLFADELNKRQDFMNEEANRLGRLQIEQMYAWCEKY